jgi:hypothetical protein
MRNDVAILLKEGEKLVSQFEKISNRIVLQKQLQSVLYRKIIAYDLP